MAVQLIPTFLSCFINFVGFKVVKLFALSLYLQGAEIIRGKGVVDFKDLFRRIAGHLNFVKVP